MTGKTEQFVKKVVGYPERSVPVVTVDNYLRQYKKDPKKSVWLSHQLDSVRLPSLFAVARYIYPESLSHPPMDQTLQLVYRHRFMWPFCVTFVQISAGLLVT
jgi:hypothetical protein